MQEPPLDLKERIFNVIKKEKIKRYTKRNQGLIFSSVLIAIVSFPYSWPSFLKELKINGFYYFIQTLFYLIFQKKILLLFQKEFFYAFFDFLPIETLLLSLINLFFISLVIYYFLLNFSFKKLIKNFQSRI